MANFPKEFSLDDLILLIERMMEIRDPYDQAVHGQRTAEMTVALAEGLDLAPDISQLVRPAARLHDLGKFFIAEDVLNKPGELTESEIYMIHQHTVLGAKAFRVLNVYPELEQVILHHHENYDGTGYPEGLAGEEIPILARMIRITDTYDALRSKRSYRGAATIEQALAAMEKQARWFDSVLFERFKVLVQEKKVAL